MSDNNPILTDKAAKPLTGKVPGVYYGYDNYQDEETEDLLDLLAEVLTGTDTRLLMNAIAEEAWPEDPHMAMKNMNPHLLDDEALEYAQGMLEEGWEAGAVLIELYDLCAVT